MNELKEKVELNPTESAESRQKFNDGFDWTHTLFTESEKEAVQSVLI